ncbi:signal recognition particle-docking protein FtsY [Otariodibacter oris]|uniref:Signal recognition particle receptor FtsY n=1 Tax=Otariodibacter oris TaxID=1032623 RepID=A0A420XEE1_9PAST|nr:signal recognition particle-docking protein FtsY [Otariodibacter oris]QGM80123.1 signal recognition particle-docking protein FtsY [Otariodibacter oris]RKR70467.1 fused signal recognition particle receptor [Otariodibacter oris]
MAENKKKKGFWSWLGLGEKEEKVEESTTTTAEEEQQVPTSQRDTELVTETAEELAPIDEKDENQSSAITENQSVEHIESSTSQQPAEEQIEILTEETTELTTITTPENDDVHEEQNEVVDIQPSVEIEQSSTESIESTTDDEYQEKPTSEGGFFSRLIKGLIKTKENIGSGFRNFFRGKKIDDELFEELEEQLLIADLGMPTTTKIINNLTQHASKKQLQDAELLYQQLKIELANVLTPVAEPLVITDKKPYVILMVGVNGVGKTTTIGKLARKFQAEGKSVMLAAGDTFRAAAVEQLQVWGERNHIPVVAQSTGSDSASVIFDAMQSAAAKGIDVLIADTAGRLQNKNNLMDELKKIVRVMKKYDETAPHEIMLTLDAGTGQNAISQAKLFNEAVGLTGITLTKLDGTAKGGVIFAIADQFKLPIRFIGVGEKIEDLRQFDANEFIEALFSHEDEK